MLEVGFTLKNPNIPSGTGARTGNVDVEMVITKLSRAVVMGKTVTKTIPLTVEVDGSGNLLECHSTLDSKALNIKLAAKQEICASLGGVWNSPNCSITNLFQQNCQNIGGSWNATNKKCSIDNLFQQNCQNIGGSWNATNKKCSIDNLFQQNCQNIGGSWNATNKKCSIDNLLQPLRDTINTHKGEPHGGSGTGDMIKNSEQCVEVAQTSSRLRRPSNTPFTVGLSSHPGCPPGGTSLANYTKQKSIKTTFVGNNNYDQLYTGWVFLCCVP